MIEIKNVSQINIMRDNGFLLDSCLQKVISKANPGVTTLALDELAESLIREAGAVPNFKGYQGYPSTLCTSVNDQVIHGRPNKRSLIQGDVLTVDVGLVRNGFHVDRATTIIVGGEAAADSKVVKFLATGREALEHAINEVMPHKHVGDISAAMQEVVERAGYSVIREFTGHGVGTKLHMEPTIPCFGQRGRGSRLEVGMTLAVEVMMNMGSSKIKTLKDGWTTVTQDGSLSAQFEHTVAVTEDGCAILTLS
jgi:methionyl aminopeptidase